MICSSHASQSCHIMPYRLSMALHGPFIAHCMALCRLASHLYGNLHVVYYLLGAPDPFLSMVYASMAGLSNDSIDAEESSRVIAIFASGDRNDSRDDLRDIAGRTRQNEWRRLILKCTYVYTPCYVCHTHRMNGDASL